MSKAILIKPTAALYRLIREEAKQRDRKLAPTVLLILAEHFNGQARDAQTHEEGK